MINTTISEKFIQSIFFESGSDAFNTILNSIDRGICLISPEYTLVLFNDCFKREFPKLHGVTPVAGLNLLRDERLSDVKEKWSSLFQQCRTTRQEVSFNTVQSEEGNSFMEHSIFPIQRDQDVGFIMISRNITKQKLLEEKKNEQQQNLIALTEVVHDPLFLLDKEFKLLSFNRAFRNNCIKIFNTNPRNGCYIFDFIPREYCEIWKPRFFEALSGKSYELEEEYAFRKVKMFYEIRISPVHYHDEIRGIVCFFKDITNRKKNEEQFQLQSMDLKKTNDELDLLVYRASHDLRAPLMSIKGLTQIIVHNAHDTVQCVNLINKSIDKLDEFVREIINYSKNARTLIENSPVDVKSIIDESVLLHRFINQNTIDVSLEIKMKYALYSDKSRIKIIVNNIISNAFKYCDSNKASYLKIKILCGKHHCRLSFTDNGQGIHGKFMNRIFDMFFRANENGSGSGLGLYIVKTILDKLNGNIRVKSSIGVGSEFVITIPNGLNSHSNGADNGI